MPAAFPIVGAWSNRPARAMLARHPFQRHDRVGDLAVARLSPHPTRAKRLVPIACIIEC
jgi:hypothetical protein